MNEVKEITFTVKRVQYQTVTISEKGGYSMPTNIKETVDLVEDFQQDPLSYTESSSWMTDVVEITHWDVEE